MGAINLTAARRCCGALCRRVAGLRRFRCQPRPPDTSVSPRVVRVHQRLQAAQAGRVVLVGIAGRRERPRHAVFEFRVWVSVFVGIGGPRDKRVAVLVAVLLAVGTVDADTPVGTALPAPIRRLPDRRPIGSVGWNRTPGYRVRAKK
jgi:hypothetical protein